MTAIRYSVLAAVCALSTAAVVTAAAQRPGTEFAQALQANRAALDDYTWKSRTEIKVKGEMRSVTLEQVRLDFDGRLQKTKIGGEAAELKQAPAIGRLGGAIGQHVVARKRERFKALVEDLAMLARSYGSLSPQRMRGFATRAMLAEGLGHESGTILVEGRDVLTTGDAMSVWIDRDTRLMRRVEITTFHDGDAVRITADHRSLDNGLTYQARSVLQYPEKNLDIIVETFDYQFVGRSR
jgi:hypothetical protein